ncbi:MAG: hypothetical protein FWE73_05275 [Candidatus Bathyarchaeota archaeon]|nr:hypothetical protein [Candidatus Termitimicrobium sp.]
MKKIFVTFLFTLLVAELVFASLACIGESQVQTLPSAPQTAKTAQLIV